MRIKGILYTVLSGLIYGFTPVLCTITYSYGNNPMTLTFFRSFLILPILLLIVKKEHINLKCEPFELLKIIFIAIFGSVFTTLLLYSSYEYIGVGTTTTLHFMYPLFVVLMCHYAYQDPISKNQKTALLIALIGIALFFDLKDLSKLKGILMALTSGMTFAVYLVGIEKLKLSKMNNFKLSFYLALCVSVTLFLVGTFTHQLNFHQPSISYLIMFMIAILAQLIAVILLKTGIDILGSSIASMFSLVEPISSICFGFLFLNEQINIFKIMGCFFIFLGMIFLLKK